MIRRFDDPPNGGRRYRLRPGAYAILKREGKILLTLQHAPMAEYQLPGGGVERGEQILPALHREVLEETGWTMQISRRLGAFRRFVYMPEYDLWAEKLCTIYLARPSLCVGPPLEPGHEAVWTTPETAVKLLGNPGDRHFMKSQI